MNVEVSFGFAFLIIVFMTLFFGFFGGEKGATIGFVLAILLLFGKGLFWLTIITLLCCLSYFVGKCIFNYLKKPKTKKEISIAIGISVLTIFISIVGVIISNIDFQQVRIEKILKKYGFQDVALVNKTVDDTTDFIIYDVNFTELKDDDYPKMFDMVEEIDSTKKGHCLIDYYYNGKPCYFDSRDQVIKSDGEELYNNYYNSEGYKKDLEAEKEREAMKIEYGDQYPAIGMSEKALLYTKLGKPNSIERCSDFNHLRDEKKYKIYKWYENEEHGDWEVWISYGKRNAATGKTEKYPGGIVDAMYYWDEEGYHRVYD